MSSLDRARLRPLLLAALLVLLIVGAYVGSLRGGFLWDDNLHITENPTIVGPLGFKEIWTTARANYFPLVLTSFKVQHALWGLEPSGYRIVTLACHVIAALLLWRVLRQLRVPGAWLGAALWALHPVQVESVAWICELKNTQSAVFFLAAIACYVGWIKVGQVSDRPSGGSETRPTGRYVLALIFAVLAILSKPSTVMLPVALALCAWWIGKGPGTTEQGRRTGETPGPGTARSVVRGLRSSVLPLAPFLALSALAAGWTIWEQKFHSGAIGAEWEQTWPERIVIAGRIAWFYLGKLLWPEPLVFIYPRWAIDAGSLFAWAAPLGVFALAAVLAWRREPAARPALFAWLYFLALLFPVLGFFNVYFFRYSFVGDHFQYLASMGPLALIGALVARLPRRTAVMSGAALVLVLGALTWRHAGTFRDMETLWRATVALNPGSKMAWLNLGDTYSRQRRSAEAIAAFRRGLELAPDDPHAHNDLGCELVLTDRAAEALPHLERAVQLKPVAEHLTNLGNALRKLDRVPEAIARFERALQLDPHHAPAHNNLAAELAELGRFDEAIAHFETALRIRPKDAATHENLAHALQRGGRRAEARAHYEAALRLEPGRMLSRKMLSDLLLAESRGAEAFAVLEEGVRQAPRSPEAHNNLGGALAQAGRLPEAIPHFEEALRLAPGFAPAHVNLGSVLSAAGRWSDAVRHLRDAARLSPRLAEAHGQLAVALVNSGSLAEAVVPFEEALRLKPESAELHDNFGQLLGALGRRREAFEHLEEAARLRREGGRRR